MGWNGTTWIKMVFDKTPGSHMLSEPLLEQTSCATNVAGIATRTCNFINNIVLEHVRNRGLKFWNFSFSFHKCHDKPTIYINKQLCCLPLVAPSLNPTVSTSSGRKHAQTFRSLTFYAYRTCREPPPKWGEDNRRSSSGDNSAERTVHRQCSISSYFLKLPNVVVPTYFQPNTSCQKTKGNPQIESSWRPATDLEFLTLPTLIFKNIVITTFLCRWKGLTLG